ncbi:MAG: hypothetical protein ACRDYE_05285 [Acidimicrobiales bacterium]
MAHTPAGGYGSVMPPPVLASCTDSIPAGAPDLRGTWGVVELTSDEPAFDPARLTSYTERIEQAADRVVVTGGGVVHDMRADGTLEHGVNDVMHVDFATPIRVAATFEDGALVLRPMGLPGVEVRRWLDGDQLRWRYGPLFTARLERVDP